MSAHLSRAELLLDQGRAKEALQEASQALAEDPDNVEALLCTARAHSELDEHRDAIRAAERAVALRAEESFPHRVLAYTLNKAGREKDAETHANESIRIDPEDEYNFIIRSSIMLSLRRWADAREDAERALALQPEQPQALNLRSMALIQLGETDEAHNTGDFALNRSPEDALSHAVKGWAHLHDSRPKEAKSHFAEALRIEPDLEYARNGMLEALKATNPIYRGMLVYFLWMGRQSSRMQWVFILTTLFGVRFVRNAASDNPDLGLILWPLIGLIYAFLFLTWTAVPMFNLLLRLNRFGRQVLNKDERFGSTIFGVSLGVIAAAAIGWGTGSLAEPKGLLATIYAAFVSVCIAASVQKTGRSRMILFAATGAIALCAMGVITANLYGLSLLVVFGFLGFQFLANGLKE